MDGKRTVGYLELCTHETDRVWMTDVGTQTHEEYPSERQCPLINVGPRYYVMYLEYTIYTCHNLLTWSFSAISISLFFMCVLYCLVGRPVFVDWSVCVVTTKDFLNGDSTVV